MTRVLYVLPELTAHQTTAAQVRAAALLPLIAEQTDLMVLTFSGAGDSPVGVEGLPEERIVRVPRADISAASLALGTVLARPRAFRRFDTPAGREALAAAIRAQQPDIVHFDGFATLGLMEVVARVRPQSRIIAHVHDAQSARMERYTSMGSLLNRVQKTREYRKSLQFESRGLGIAALTLVDSDEDRDYLRRRIGSDTVETLPLGFNPESFTPDGPKAELVQPAIVYSGSMKADQSVDAAVFLAHEVMPLVWRTAPEAQLYIVGGGPTEKVRALEGERIHVTGFVDDLAAYLRASSVYACPLRLGSGMRTRVVEALACGTSMVATSMAVRGLGNPADGVAWVQADTAPEFAQAVLRTLASTDATMGGRAAVFAYGNYSWSSIASRLVDYYSKVTEQ
ncbi:glycosyltransferase [Rhodovulum sulfidophilum]|uniref:glycosyltransferase family 4 protein n=1 Tax=Rhodovulum sulfidophilum TaxID=35806 RepID=UPI001921D3C0|nr:glycosyltransferase family 4 protein [Rhodovulum sulfidophilum]MBL3563682.1 glycosyltransferase [Rhodovulum sulfidophilum]